MHWIWWINKLNVENSFISSNYIYAIGFLYFRKQFEQYEIFRDKFSHSAVKLILFIIQTRTLLVSQYIFFPLSWMTKGLIQVVLTRNVNISCFLWLWQSHYTYQLNYVFSHQINMYFTSKLKSYFSRQFFIFHLLPLFHIHSSIQINLNNIL